MVSIEQYFGECAGVIWRALNGKAPQSLSQLSRSTKLSPARLNAGLGWLAREGKLQVDGDAPLRYRFSLK
ncbi:TPA: winged helix-turn-helix domain-containing protein [Candidatus Micrarchaeota archaeon]|nr:MAG: hypothetical protein AUJ65_05275 [Candidatus Micrarchaeota archaeon CG1_02_51_15]HII38898.1 winged helix-turn-helix domain-containing protein [Candidatus Micrarchaeota archaeon]